MLVYQRVPQQEWHIDGEFNEVVPRSLGSMTASERIQVVLRLRSRSGSRLSFRGFQRCQKPTMTGDGFYQTLMVMTWGWFMIGFTTKDIKKIYTKYYIMLYQIILYYIMLYYIISYHIILYYVLHYIIFYIMTHKLIYTTREVECQQLTLHSACLIRTADGGTLAPRFP